MRNKLLIIVVAGAVLTTSAAAQNRSPSMPPPAAGVYSAFAGKWTYRSYHNTAWRLVGEDASKAVAMIFGEGVFTFETPSTTSIVGRLDMGSGYVLDLQGTIRLPAANAPLTIKFVGMGRRGTRTEGWQYDYHGFLAYHWPNGVNQVPALVGSVIRAKPHGSAKAGYVASFIAVRQP
jgi:opacity protein-like surface antigen